MLGKAFTLCAISVSVLVTGCLVFAWAQNGAGASGSFVRQVKLSEILIPLSPSASAEEVTSAEKEALSIVGRLKNGALFEQEAREHSKGPTAAQGGNVGYFRQGALAPALEEQVFNLKVGSVTRPIRTKQGLVILEVTDVSENPPKSNQGGIDILTDTEGIDFGSYLSSVLERIRKNWYDAMPQEARLPTSKRGAVAIVFSIRKDGTVAGMAISTPSGEPELDRAAWKAISTSSPLPPLPTQFTKDALALRIRFFYNPNSLGPTSVESKFDTQSPKQK